VVGLGPGSIRFLPEANATLLRASKKLILRTRIHPIADVLAREGVAFQTCDDLYDTAENFGQLYESIADRILAAGEEVVYAVPGHPSFGEESVRILAEKARIEIIPAPSFVDAVLSALAKPFSGSLQIWNAHEAEKLLFDPRAAQLIYQVDSPQAASEAKLRLMKRYPFDYPVHVVSRAGCDDEAIAQIPLEDIDRRQYDPLTSIYLEGMPLERSDGFYGLVEIVDRLLGPGGCPWDREQTHESLKKHLVEETYEVIEAIDSGDSEKLCEELGDLLLQSVMHAQMSAIEGVFDIEDVVAGISNKLVRRHPHVFGDVSVEDSQEVLRNWDAIKQKESAEPKSILEGVPRSLPALQRAAEVSKRVVRVGFEWGSLDDVFSKMDEERAELRSAISQQDALAQADELGDLLFTIVNISRWLKVDPEDALRTMVDRFTARFKQMESAASKPLRELSLEEWDDLWEKAKAASI
jgi:tetrapyrrole methylase family protein/MazG family protein